MKTPNMLMRWCGIVAGAAMAWASDAPPELAELRAEFQRRSQRATSSLEAWYQGQIKGLLARYQQQGRFEAVEALQKELAEAGSAVKEGCPISELAGLYSAYTVSVHRAMEPVYRWYQQQLELLESNFVRQGDLPAAAAVKKEKLQLLLSSKPSFENAVATPGVQETPGVRRAKIRYSYRSLEFCRGIYDYSDTNCVKLLDGHIAEQHSPHMVAWQNIKPPPIRFEFDPPMRPRVVRIHVLGGNPSLGYTVPKTIEVRRSVGRGIGDLIARVTNLPDRTDWVEIPLSLTELVSSLWIILDRSGTSLVGIDEIEFR